MYDASNNTPDWTGEPDMLGLWAFQEDIKRTLNINTNIPTKQEDIHADNDINGDETNSSDSFFSIAIETIQFLMREFTKVFEAYSGIE
jgi:hypothetical protein